MLCSDLINRTVISLLPEAQKFLTDLIKIPSLSGQEQAAMEITACGFSNACDDISKIPLTEKLLSDPGYSSPIQGIKYDGRYNLTARCKGSGSGKCVILNTHIDTVPPSEGMENPYSGKVENGIVYGRGACDAKGQVATIWLVFKTLMQLDIRLKGDVTAHIVVEEENGGNGSLAMARSKPKADTCIVLEPSSGKLFSSIRGAVWFKITFKGITGHSGQAGQTKSALLMARDAMSILEKYHADLLASSRGFRFFDDYPNPMPITFGKLEAGNWPAAVPSKAVLEGVLGILPNKTKEQVCREISAVLINGLGVNHTGQFDLSFTYQHDSSVLDWKHELPQGIVAAAKKNGHELAIDAMTASCDAWLYNNQLGIPTVVFGAGSLREAHSKDEHIKMDEIKVAAKVLISFLIDFCGME